MDRHTHRTHRRGADAIEFALVLPVLFGLMGAIMDYGWYFHRQLALVGIVRDATRAAATAPLDPNLTPEQVAEEKVLLRLDDYGYSGQVAINVATYGQAPAKRLEVAVALPHQSLVGFGLVPHKLVSVYSMRLEDQPQ